MSINIVLKWLKHLRVESAHARVHAGHRDYYSGLYGPSWNSKTYNFQQRADIIMQGVPINMGIQ